MTTAERRFPTLLAGLTLLGLLVRLWSAWATSVQSPDAVMQLGGDEPGYDWLARQLLDGNVFAWPGRAPVYPAFLAAIYGLLGHSYAAVLLVQACLGAAVVPLVWWLSRWLAGERVALVAAGLAALDPALIRYPDRLQPEILLAPLLLLVVLALARAADRPTVLAAAGFGAVAGLAALTRADALVLPWLLLPLLPHRIGWRRRLALGGLAIGVSAVAMAPWLLGNLAVHGALLPINATGSRLWQGSPEYLHRLEAGQSFEQVWATDLDPAVNGGLEPESVAGTEAFNARALASIRAEPGTYLLYTLHKALYFWLGHPMNRWEWPFSPAVWTYFATPLQAGALIVARLAPLAALAALVARRRQLAPFAPLLAVVGALWLLHALTSAEARDSLPLQPLLLVPIAAALTELASGWRVEPAPRAPVGPAAPRAVGERAARRPTIHALTGLRFLAALAVVLYHFREVAPFPPLLTRFVLEGAAGVSLFFILSGVVLVYNYRDWFTTSLGRYGRFLGARLARIYPMYLVALLAVTPLVLTSPKLTYGLTAEQIAGAWWLNATLLHVWVPHWAMHVWNPPSWSVANELFFYLMLPLAIRYGLVRLTGRRALAVAATVCYLIGLGIELWLPAVLDHFWHYQIWNDVNYARYLLPTTRLWEFLIGALLGALLLDHGLSLGHRDRLVRNVALGVVLAALAGVAWYVSSDALADAEYWLRRYVLYTPLLAALIALLAGGRTWLSPLLESRPLLLLGEASYSLYLIHWLALSVLTRLIGETGRLDWPQLIGAVALTVAGSVLCYKLIESPARRALQPRRPERPAPPAAAVWEPDPRARRPVARAD